MTDKLPSDERSKQRGGWLRKLLIAIGVLTVLLIAGYFVVTSAGFFKAVVLPRVGRAIDAELTVADASISPFSRIVLHKLKLQPHGREPLVTADEVRVNYCLRDIIRGKITVAEVTIESPALTLIENADGTSNLAPIRRALARKPAPKVEQPPARPTQLTVGKVEISNATVRIAKQFADGQLRTIELANLDLAVADVKNGQAGTLKVGAAFKAQHQSAVRAAAGLLVGKLAGQVKFGLAQDLQPNTLEGALELETTEATGAWAEFGALRAELRCDVTPVEIKELAVRFFKSGTQLGQARVSGPFDIERASGTLLVEVLNLDREVLNAVGASRGLDFGTTTINSTNRVQIGSGASAIVLDGQLRAEKFTVSRAGQPTPALDLHADYSLRVDRTTQLAELKGMTVTGTQAGRRLLDARLARPMTVAWGTADGALPDSALEARLDKLDLADWRVFLGRIAPAGRANVQAKLVSEQAGKQLRIELGATLAELELVLGTNRVSGLKLDIEARAQAREFKHITLSEWRAGVAVRGRDVAALAGSGSFDLAPHVQGEAQLKLTGMAPAIAQLFAPATVAISDGTLALEARVAQQAGTQRLTGTLQMDSVSGGFGQSMFADFDVMSTFDLVTDARQVNLRSVKCGLFQADKPCGNIELAGRYDLQNRAGELTLQLSGLSERALAPVLGPMLKDKTLRSVTVNCTASAKLDTALAGAAQAELAVANLVVSDPKGRLPTTPLEARVRFDGLVRTQIVELRQCELALTPTARAKNQLSLTGTVDLSKPNAIAGQLKLGAELLDATSYYDLFAGKPSEKPAQPTPAPAPAQQNEPPPVKLPLEKLGAELAIGRLYLREVEVANLQARLRLDGGRVVIDPVQFALNGAPVNAKFDLDLGVPGYRYDVSFSANGVPIEPLANSFGTDYKNRAKGNLIATAQIKGAGITGASLQKSLTGAAAISITNANIQLVGRKAKLLITPIAFVLGLDELTRAAVSGLNAQLTMGNGRITLTQGEVFGEVFIARTAGQMQIAPELTNSRFDDWPINFLLSRRLAEVARLVAPGAEPGTGLVTLPTFVKLGGTLGKPEAKTDKLVIAGLVAKTAGVIPGVAGSKAGAILQGVGGLLTGQLPGGQTPSTNQPPTNVPPQTPVLPISPLDLFKRR